jgi:hypothetical protein
MSAIEVIFLIVICLIVGCTYAYVWFILTPGGKADEAHPPRCQSIIDIGFSRPSYRQCEHRDGHEGCHHNDTYTWKDIDSITTIVSEQPR